MILNVASIPKMSDQRTKPFRDVAALIIKVTSRCNLDCSYCYEDVSSNGPDMDISTFRNLVEEVFNQTISNKVTIIFHGGEPSLVDPGWFILAVSYATYFAKFHGKRVKFCIQTNLIRLTEPQIQLYKELKISVGASLDGPFSNDKSFRLRNDTAFRNFIRLKRAGVNTSILTTINKSNWNHFHKILPWIYESTTSKVVKINIAYSVGAGATIADMSSEEIICAQKEIIDYMIRTKGTQLLEKNLVREIIKFFESDRNLHSQGLCNKKVCGAGENVVGISPNGDLLPCGRFEWHDPNYRLGSINDENFPFWNDQIRTFQSSSPDNWISCSNCQAEKICSFGCQAFIVRSRSKKNIECAPTQWRYHYFQQKREDLELVYHSGKSKGLS